MPLLDDCPYYVQALFWVLVLGGSGWLLGLGIEQTRRTRARVRVTRQREEVRANR